jgi:hypothetical protein
MGITTLLSEEENIIMEVLPAALFFIFIPYFRSYTTVNKKTYLQYVEEIIQEDMPLP